MHFPLVRTHFGECERFGIDNALPENVSENGTLCQKLTFLAGFGMLDNFTGLSFKFVNIWPKKFQTLSKERVILLKRLLLFVV